MSKEAHWKECLEDFLVSAEGDYTHSESLAVYEGRPTKEHTLFAKKETITWNIDTKTNEILGVKHLGR